MAERRVTKDEIARLVALLIKSNIDPNSSPDDPRPLAASPSQLSKSRLVSGAFARLRVRRDKQPVGPSRQIICADAMEWMKTAPIRGSVVTSLPDADEAKKSTSEWKTWFVDAAAQTMKMAVDTAPAIFYQVDRRGDGGLISKAHLLMKAAEREKRRLLWHKIITILEPGTVNKRTIGYAHLMAFSVTGKPGDPTPDVLQRGSVNYANAIGIIPARMAVEFAGNIATPIIDPFCGRGTIPAMAESLGFNSVGIDIDEKQCDKARAFRIAES